MVKTCENTFSICRIPCIYRVRQKNDPLAKLRYYDNRQVFLHNFCLAYRGDILTCFPKVYSKILKTSKVMNFLRKISKFQNQAWKGNDRLLNSFLNYVVALKRAESYVMVVNADYYEIRCSKCTPSALIHACSLFLNARTAFLMDPCGKWF